MADRILLESGSPDGYLLEDSSGVLLVEAAPKSYRDEVLTDSPIAYYRLGEPSGTAMLDEIGARTGTYAGAPALAQAGALTGDANTAVAFDGTSAEYGSVAGWTTPPAGAMTLECWAKRVSGWPTDTGLGGFHVGGGVSRILYVSGNGSSVINIKMWTELGVGGVGTDLDFSDGGWHHIVGTLDGSDNGRLYFDGALVAGPTALTASDGNTGNPFVVGTYGAPIDNFSWPGGIDEFAVYDTALSAARVLAHYEAGVPAAGTNAPAGTATGTGAASNAAASLKPNAATATGTGTGLVAGKTVKPNAGTATGTGTALNATVATAKAAAAGVATGSGAASNAATSVKPNTGTATGTGTAYNATASTATLANAGVAAGTGAANNASVSVKASAGVATASGAAGNVTASVAVGADAATTALLRDAFGRVVVDGLGSADIGGAYSTHGGSASDYDVTGSNATILSATRGVERLAIAGSSAADVDLYARFQTNNLPVAVGLNYQYLIARFADSSNYYRAKVYFGSTGFTPVGIDKVVAGAVTEIASAAAPQTTAAATWYWIKFRVKGSDLWAKTWEGAIGDEPSAWQVHATDGALAAAGQTGFGIFQTSDADGTVPTVSWDDIETAGGSPFGVAVDATTKVSPVVAIATGTGTGLDATAATGNAAAAGVATGFGNPTYEAAIFADNPIAYYRLGESDGATVAVDATGNHTGAYVGSPDLGEPGALVDSNTAMELDGSGSAYAEVADWLTIPAPPCSIEAWIRHDGSDFTLETTIAGAVKPVDQGLRLMAWTIDADTMELGVYTEQGNANFHWTPGGDTDWHHLVGVINAAGTTATLYFDGVLVAGPSVVVYPGFGLTATVPFRIGTGTDTGIAGTQSWPGGIDEVAVYDTALSLAQVQAHYDAAAAPGNGASTRVAPFAGSAAGSGAASNVTASTTDEAPAGTAQGSGTGANVSARIDVSVSTATGTGTALDATATTAGAALATTAEGSGTGLGTSAAIGASAQLAAGSGDAYGIGASTTDEAPADTATGTGTGLGPSVALQVNAATATGTGEAFDATSTTARAALAEVAEGSGAAFGSSAAIAPAAQVATGTGEAIDVAASTTDEANADTAMGAGVGLDATTAIEVHAATATGSGEALDATTTTALGALAEVATGSGAAADAAAGVAPTAILAEGSGDALEATVATVGEAPAGTAFGSGEAFGPLVAIDVNAATATGSGDAYDATTVTSAATVANAGTATGSGTARNATITGIGVITGGGAGPGKIRPRRKGDRLQRRNPDVYIRADSRPQVPVLGRAETATAYGTAHDATVEWDDDETAMALLLEAA